jgi:hypothetical protein
MWQADEASVRTPDSAAGPGGWDRPAPSMPRSRSGACCVICGHHTAFELLRQSAVYSTAARELVRRAIEDIAAT